MVEIKTVNSYSIRYKGEYSKNEYGLSFEELEEEFVALVEMNDNNFFKNISRAIHFAVFICYIKQIPSYLCLADEGIIHELVHLLQHGKRGGIKKFSSIRKQFKRELKP